MSQFETTKLHPIQESGNEAQDILLYVYNALQAKGYDPITQLVGYIISGDPTYITSYNSARSMICRLERGDILEELVRFYLAPPPPPPVIRPSSPDRWFSPRPSRRCIC